MLRKSKAHGLSGYHSRNDLISFFIKPVGIFYYSFLYSSSYPYFVSFPLPFSISHNIFWVGYIALLFPTALALPLLLRLLLSASLGVFLLDPAVFSHVFFFCPHFGSFYPQLALSFTCSFVGWLVTAPVYWQPNCVGIPEKEDFKEWF